MVSKCFLANSNVWSFDQVCNHIQSEKYLATSVEEFCTDLDRVFQRRGFACAVVHWVSQVNQNPFQTRWPGRQNGMGCACLTEKQSGTVHWKGIICLTAKKEFRHSTVWSDRHLCRPPQTLWKGFFWGVIRWEWFCLVHSLPDANAVKWKI